jgi:hypothetical protein
MSTGDAFGNRGRKRRSIATPLLTELANFNEKAPPERGF